MCENQCSKLLHLETDRCLFAFTAPDLRQSQSILTQDVQPANVFAETEPLETDVAFVSKAVTQTAKAANDFLNFVTFASYEATVWESVWTQFSNLDTLLE